MRVGRYSWWDRIATVKHDPQPILIAVDSDFRILVGCSVRHCTRTWIIA